MGCRIEQGDDLTPYVQRIHEQTVRALQPGWRYEIRTTKQMVGNYYLQEIDDAAFNQLSRLQRWFARVLPLSWRRRWIYTYVPWWYEWTVVWYSLPKTFAQETDWVDFVHTSIPPDEEDFDRMLGLFVIGRETVPLQKEGEPYNIGKR